MSQNDIAIAGSVSHVLEFLRYAINGILFHRGVYPAEDFFVEKRFGLDLTLIISPSVEDYIEITMMRMRDWLLDQSVTHMVVVLLNADDGKVVERWVFEPKFSDIDLKTSAQIDSQMHHELSAVMKDIVTPTFLPPLELPMVFDILVYTRNTAHIPDGWDQTHSHPIEEGDLDTLKALRAPQHTVALSVAYREEE